MLKLTLGHDTFVNKVHTAIIVQQLIAHMHIPPETIFEDLEPSRETDANLLARTVLGRRDVCSEAGGLEAESAR